MTPAAVVFDLFGTLLDISSLCAAVGEFVPDRAAFVATWREKQLAYAFSCTLMEWWGDFDEMTRKSLDYAAVLSVNAVRVYKPSPAVYALATAHFGASAERIVFVSANGWDATGAATFGFRTVWCNRLGLPTETLGPKPAATITALHELVEYLQRESLQ